MDFERIEKVFKEYANNFDMNNERISLKYYHTIEVANISYEIAKRMGLSKEDRDLAKLIGYLHDIGRFEQVATTNSFKDIITDHADNGVKLLFEEGLIRKFIDDTKYDEIIRKAVKNHNKYKILDEVLEKEKLFANIIRDADKIDIYRVDVKYEYHSFKDMPSKETLDCIENGQSVKIKDIKNKSDSTLCVLAFLYDMNYEESFEVLRQTKYYERYLEHVDVSEEYKELFERVKEIVLRELGV